MGVIAPNGTGVDDFWNSLVRGESAVRRVTHFDASTYPCQIAAEVRDFDPGFVIWIPETQETGPVCPIRFAASQMAVEDAQVDFSR